MRSTRVCTAGDFLYTNRLTTCAVWASLPFDQNTSTVSSLSCICNIVPAFNDRNLVIMDKRSHKWLKTLTLFYDCYIDIIYIHVWSRGHCGRNRMIVVSAFSNILVISWRSVLLVEETGVPGDNHRPVTSHWQTLLHNVVLSTHRQKVVFLIHV
jgi:hypothetical protein